MSESTVRRWCDQGLLSSGRTSGRHRRIDQGELLAFARAAGLFQGGDHLPSPAGRGGRLAPAVDVRSRFVEALVEGGDAGLRAFFATWLEQGGAPARLFDEVVAPGMRTVGDRWAEGTLAIYEEHAATQRLLGALVAAEAYLPPERAADPTAVCASLAGDPYALGPHMAAQVVRTERFRPLLLGADTPAAEVARAARATSARLVLVSIGCTPERARVRRDLAMLVRTATELGAVVVVGGRARHEAVKPGAPNMVVLDTMMALAALAREVRGGGRPATPARRAAVPARRGAGAAKGPRRARADTTRGASRRQGA